MRIRWYGYLGFLAVAGGCTQLLGISGDYVVGTEAGAGSGGSAGADAADVNTGGDINTRPDSELNPETPGLDTQNGDVAAPEASAPEAGDASQCDAGAVLCGDQCVRILGNDPANCGACGRSCCGATCQAGVCLQEKILGFNQKQPHGIAVDAKNVYWANVGASATGDVLAGEGEIWRAPKDGSGATVFVSSLDGPEDIVVDKAGEHLYWTSRGVGSNGGRVQRASLEADGGAVVEVLADGQNKPLGLALDTAEQHVYWVNATDSSEGSVRRAPVGGGPVQVVQGGLSSARFVAILPDNNVYWTLQNGKVYRRPESLSGDGGTLFASSQWPGYRIAGTAELVFWTTFEVGLVSAGIQDGGVTPAFGDQKRTAGIALDSEAVYWTVYDDVVGAVRKRSIASSLVFQTIANDSGSPYHVAVDDKCAYWTSPGDLLQHDNKSGFVKATSKYPLQ